MRLLKALISVLLCSLHLLTNVLITGSDNMR